MVKYVYLLEIMYIYTRTDIELPDIEYLWVEFHIHDRNILLGPFTDHLIPYLQ